MAEDSPRFMDDSEIDALYAKTLEQTSQRLSMHRCDEQQAKRGAILIGRALLMALVIAIVAAIAR